MVDVDREVDAQRMEVERLQRQQREVVEEGAAGRRREEAEHAVGLMERERAATAQLDGEVARLQAAIQQALGEQIRLADETARRREGAERDHAAAMRKIFARQRDAEEAAAVRLRKLGAEFDERHAQYLRLKQELALLQDQGAALQVDAHAGRTKANRPPARGQRAIQQPKLLE